MKIRGNRALRQLARQLALWLKIAVLIFAGIAPALMADDVTAAQLTPRRLTIGTSQSNVETTYDFDFRMPTATPIQGIIFEFCDAPLGTCTLPTGMDVFTDTAVSDQDFDDETDPFAVYASTDLGDCTNHNNSTSSTQVCVERTETDAESAAPDEKSITLSDILNPTLSGVYLTFYVRVTLYSDTSFATDVHAGTVAAAIVQRLTSVGRVAERLEFCVGAVEDEPSVAFPVDCSDANFPTVTTVDLGIIDNTSVTASPVDPSISNANLSNDRYGLLMVNTNASAGVVITFFPEAATNVSASDTDQLRAFRVLPTDCSATPSSTTDQCFVSTGEAGSGISATQEEFGMAVACISTQGTTDNFDPTNLGTIGAAYVGDSDFDDDNVGFVDDCENEAITSYTWGFDDDVSNGIATLASTATSTNKVVDDEAIKLRFGAAASATTPTGTYQVTTTYIATPTF